MRNQLGGTTRADRLHRYGVKQVSYVDRGKQDHECSGALTPNPDPNPTFDSDANHHADPNLPQRYRL